MDPENQMEISVEDPPPLERNFYDSPIREEESEDAQSIPDDSGPLNKEREHRQTATADPRLPCSSCTDVYMIKII